MHLSKKIKQMGIIKRTIVMLLAALLLTQPLASISFADFDTSPVRVNQIGYLPLADKVATIVTPSSSTSPIAWELRTQSGTLVTSGTTTVYGNDVASGDYLHHADFSAVTALGTYRIVVPGVGQSVLFDITNDPYPTLANEAMEYFYFHRLGEDLDGFAGTPYYRPAIHENDDAIACYYPVESDPFDGRIEIPMGPDWCGGELLNVKNSWADAGDLGIYPVNHAISAWTLLNLFERNPGVFADGSLSLSAAERTNGIPDIIDEVNFGSTYLKGMLPSNPNLLASHKVHNDDFGVRPGVDPWWQDSWDISTTTWYEWHERAGKENPNQIFDTTAEAFSHFESYHNAFIVNGSIPVGQTINTLRYAQKPSTASTYAVARVLAQLSRILDQYPSTQSLAADYWAAAQDAWTRATTLPVVYAQDLPSPDRMIESPGGGDYPDNNIADDRFAAAVEMYLTAYSKGASNVNTFKTEVTSSSYYKQVDLFNWQQVGPTGNISLISVPNDLPSNDLQAIRTNITNFASVLQGQLNAEGYPTPLSPEINGSLVQYPWGSNSFVTNYMMYFGYAYDITSNLQFLKDMHRSMDYLMGNNAVRTSFVTGYGEYHETDTHDRFAWVLHTNDNVPYPKGWISGGPNNKDGDDGITPKHLPPAKSYAGPGQVQAFASKENTINWNAPFAWVVAYMNEKKADLVGGTPVLPGDFTLNAVTNEGTVGLSWTASSNATSYTVQRALSANGTYTTLASGLTGTSYTDTTVSNNGETYYYKVIATNSVGDKPSNVASVTTGGYPGPFTLTTTVTNGTVALEWTPSTRANQYYVFRSLSPTGPFQLLGQYSSATTTLVDSNVSNGLTYYYRIDAVNNVASTSSNTVSVTLESGVQLPGNFTLSATAGNGSVDLSWTTSANATSYNVLRATTGAYTTIATGLTGNAYTDATATNGITYSYKVVAVNSAGTKESNIVTATPQAGIQQPGSFTLSATAGNGSVSLSWTASANAASYTVVRELAAGGGYTTVATGLTATSYTDNTVTNGTAYIYRVIAVNTAGSTNSNTVQATPQLPGTGGLVVQYRAADTAATDQQMKPHFQIINNRTSAVNLSNLKIRYWYSSSTTADQFNCDWATIGCGNVTGTFMTLGQGAPGADKYLEVGFTSGTLAAGNSTGEIQARVNKADWSTYDESDDYSFNPSLTSFADWNKVTLYENGVLVWGVEPVLTNPNTPQAPTGLSATAGDGQVTLNWNATDLALSYNIKRSTTNGGPYTEIGSTSSHNTSFIDTNVTNGTTYYYVVDAGNYAGRSPNSLQVSATPTGGGNGGGGDVAVEYRANDTNPNDNQINMGLRVVNTGSSALNLSDVKLRYYLTLDGAPSFITFCDWAQVDCSNVQISVVQLGAPVTGASHYVEVSFRSGTVAVGNNSGDIQLRVHHSDWSNLNESNDYSYDGTKTSFAQWNKVTAHIGGAVAWGVAP